MTEKLTFKQYLESKELLKKALENTPTTINEYVVCSYCSLPLGETKEESKLISLKPRSKIIIEWRYDNVDDPTVMSVRISGSKDVDEFENHSTFWENKKLQKWLTRHTKKSPHALSSNGSTKTSNDLETARALALQSTTGSLGNQAR